MPDTITKATLLPLKPYIRDDGNDQIPSKADTTAATPLGEHPKYSGTYVIGFNKMHKSNYVPVVTKEMAVATTKMRRD